MKILLVFATYSSGTDVASGLVEKLLTERQHAVSRKDVRELQPDELNNYDLVILASPSWLNEGKDGMPHEFFLRFFERAQRKTFEGKSFAIFGLGDTAYPKFCGAVDHLVEFVAQLKGKLVTEPLRIDGFFFDQANNTQRLIEWTEKLLATLASE